MGDGRRPGGLWTMICNYDLPTVKQKHWSLHCDVCYRIIRVFCTIIGNNAGSLLQKQLETHRSLETLRAVPCSGVALWMGSCILRLPSVMT